MVIRLCKLLLLNELMDYLLLFIQAVIPYREVQTCDTARFISQTWLFQVILRNTCETYFNLLMILKRRFKKRFSLKFWVYMLVIMFTDA